MHRYGIILVVLSLLGLVACGPEQPEVEATRAELSGESPLVAHFREAEDAYGVPAELLATVGWMQSRLSMNMDAYQADDHGLGEVGVMAIGTGGLTTLDQAAALVALTPDELRTDARSNVLAAAAIMADEAQRQGLVPVTHADWAPVLDAYGGPALTESVLRLLRTGWNGWDDADLGVEVEGTGEPAPEQPSAGDGLGVTQQALGYPGAKWSPAYGGNYSNASRGAGSIDYVVIHTIQGSYAGAISWFKNPAANVSAHYVVRSSDGQVTQMVDDRDIAWHDGCFNTNSIGIEHEGFVSQPKKWYTDALYRSSARLTSWLADKYNIPKDRKHIMGHGETPDCSDHSDPGSGWDWAKYMKLVKNGGKVETVKAKLTKKWSNAKKFRGKKADYIVCPGDDFRMSFTFKNTGTARWRDVKGRGDKMGSDVFLVTTSGKKDKLTGKVRYSVKKNRNYSVRGDHKAKNCENKPGCRKTTFVKGGMIAKAPKKAGIYTTSWRLRDYSKAHGKKSLGFGPKVKLRVKVRSTCESGACGCTVFCTDGSKKKIPATSNAECKTQGKQACQPAQYLAHSYNKCAPDPDPGSGGSGSTGGTSSSGGSGGTSSSGGASGSGTGGASGSSADTGGGEPLEGDDDNAIISTDEPEDEDYIEPEDDPEFDDHGFEGEETEGDDDYSRGEALGGEGAGCSVSTGGKSPGGSGMLFVLGAAAAVVALRRRRAQRLHKLAAASSMLAGLGALGATGCAFGEATSHEEGIEMTQQAVSAPKKAYCKVPVVGKGVKDMETDYIPHVVTCENGGAGFQALKAQAIAARSVAYYSMKTKGSICDSQGCQVYGCGAAPSAAAKKAAKETAGMYLSYSGDLTYAFYVAGGSPSSSSCHDTSGYTSHYVTYNWGKTGKGVEQTSLGWIGPPGNGQNRGCMSQLGARCLESKKNFDFTKILRFYYGSDIKIVQAEGPCVGEKKTLKAKATKKWSNLKKYRGKKADYIACAGKPFSMAFTFKNTGSARWRDVKGRGKEMGSDVFLVTTTGKKDKLTGKVRYSVKLNKNKSVRGDHKAKNCDNKNGCRKTTFIKGGVKAKAPKKPGIYRSRWRLRDYSKHWGKKSKAFGPKVELSVRVKECSSDNCGCHVWCTDGSKKKIPATSNAECKSQGKAACQPAGYLAHQYESCTPSGSGGGSGSGGTAGSGGASGSAGTGSGGVSGSGWGGDTGGGTDGTEAPTGDDGAGEPADETGSGDDVDPNAIATNDDEPESSDESWGDEEEDPEWQDDGFNGDEEGIENQTSEQSGGCSLTTAPSSSGGAAIGMLSLLGLALVRRRRSARR